MASVTATASRRDVGATRDSRDAAEDSRDSRDAPMPPTRRIPTSRPDLNGFSVRCRKTLKDVQDSGDSRDS